MGRDIINMVEAATFLGLVMLMCVTALIIMVTGLLTLMGWELMVEKWNDIKNR
jgi:hypothetical protein